jgi:signal transduction histidine kinase
MENNRNQGSENLNSSKTSFKKKFFFYGFISSGLLAAVLLVLTFFLPAFISSNYYQKSLGELRSQAKSIKNEFASLIHSLNEKQKLLSNSPFPVKKNEIFSLFKKISVDREKEGVGYFNGQGEPILWIGNITDPKALFSAERKDAFLEQKSSLLIRYKASVYLASSQKVREDEHVIVYRLLAFVPQFKTPYLKEYHFLKPKLLSNCDISYWDFREDISGFEKLFSKHGDEYTAEPRLQEGIETMLFPLRNEKGKIVATVRLNSPSLSAEISSQKENFFLVFYILLGISLLCLLIHLVKSPSFYRERKLLPGFLVALTLVGLRLIFFPLSNLEKVQSLSFFSPSSASFISLWDFTKSPADIFLSSLLLVLIIGCWLNYSRTLFQGKKRKSSFLILLALNSIFIFTSLAFIFAFQEILFRLVLNSNINLLRFSFKISFFLLHLSILLFFLFSVCAIFIGLKIISRLSSGPFLSFLFFLLEFGAYLLFFRGRNIPLLFLLQAVIVIMALSLAFFPSLLKRKEVLFLALFLCTLFIYTSLHHSSSSRNQSLIQNSLQNVIKSEENWGIFLLKQSLPEVDKRKEAVISFLKSSQPVDLAHSLWERTLVAKFNWYSSLEILSPGGEILSRFSLNMPKLYRLDFDLPLSHDWSFSRLNIPFMGEAKDFLLAYKDWFDSENHLGKTILYLSIDYDMLPFLYSANPYFELLRVTSIPFLNQLDFGFAIFDLEGKLLFNPNEISSGLAPGILTKIGSSQESLWLTFTDRGKKFNSFYFRKDSRIYSLFLAKKNFINDSAEFLKLLFFYLAFFLLFLLVISILSRILSRKKFRNLFWSFSNRVYVSFAAVIIIPVLLFTFFSRNFFGQIFSHQFTEKAQAQASLAQRVMEDFILFQQEEMASPAIPPENVVLWISSTISNDVNLYQDGKLISSSRREFFDYGLLPDYIDGEIYYKIQYENNPFYTQIQKIGNYSFHTLTAPFLLRESLLLISLPFPLEQQQIAKATEGLIEFLFFISVFLIAAVLIFARSIGSTIVNPIKKLLVATKEVSSGNLEISISHKPQDEMKTLIDGFNAMVQNLKRQQQELAEMSKKAAWAEIAQKIAHEIKNPLTPIQLSAEHLLKVFQDKDQDFDQTLKESVSYIIKEVENLRKISQEFLEFSKDRALQIELFNLKDLVGETIFPYRKVLSEKIRFKEKYEGQNFNIEGDKDKIKIALRNIFTNAIEAIGDKGAIEVKASEEKEGITLEIKDNGIGMEREVLERVFESYFSTKDSGTGLGLPIAKKIIEDHSGSIQISSRKNKGTKISIYLPKMAQAR